MQEKGKNIVHFTDWEQPGEISVFYNEVKVWQVALATTAASTFFKPARIPDGDSLVSYVNVGLGNNNPIDNLWDEAGKKFGRPLEDKMPIILSTGTEKPPLEPLGTKATELAKSLVGVATDTEKTHKVSERAHYTLAEKGLYFRFNPSYLKGDVELEGYKDAETIIVRSQAYVNENATQRMFASFRDKCTGDQQHGELQV